jgi:hypothetical protein
MEGLRNLPIFPFGGVEDERCDIYWLSPTKPRSMPEGRFLPIPNRDRSCIIEDIYFCDLAAVSLRHVAY